MKNTFSALVLSTIAFQAYGRTEIVNAPVNHIYVPQGFDDNDNIEVLVSGTFPSPRYSRNRVESKVEDHKIIVTITALVSGTPGNSNEDFSVPFLENVTIGNLVAGSYQIQVNGVLKEELQVVVAPTATTDTYLYSPVDYIELGFTGGINGEAWLVGRGATCLELERMEVISNKRDTLSVLPIMRRVSSDCSERQYFRHPLKFDPQAFNYGKILLFVRTIDGRAVYTVVDKH